MREKTMSAPQADVFTDGEGRLRLVRGVAIYSNAPRLAELAVKVGFDTVWVEMEHGTADYAAAEALCFAVEAAGGFGTIRVPDGQRCHVLRALETGARIVVVPMVNTADQARAIVEFGKFPPLGARGFNTRSRGVGYGLMRSSDAFAEANARTSLFAQIETVEAVRNLDAICGVEGLAGVFIGPGDLSMSLGCGGDLAHPDLIRTTCDCIRQARAAGRHAGILVGAGPLLKAAIEAGCDWCICGGDVAQLIPVWEQLLKSIPARSAWERGTVPVSRQVSDGSSP